MFSWLKAYIFGDDFVKDEETSQNLFEYELEKLNEFIRIWKLEETPTKYLNMILLKKTEKIDENWVALVPNSFDFQNFIGIKYKFKIDEGYLFLIK